MIIRIRHTLDGGCPNGGYPEAIAVGKYLHVFEGADVATLFRDWQETNQQLLPLGSGQHQLLCSITQGDHPRVGAVKLDDPFIESVRALDELTEELVNVLCLVGVRHGNERK